MKYYKFSCPLGTQLAYADDTGLCFMETGFGWRMASEEEKKNIESTYEVISKFDFKELCS